MKCSRGSSVTYGWSRDSTGWNEPIVQQTMEALQLSPVNVDGCAFGLEIDGKFSQRPWLIQTDNPRLLRELSTKKCTHPKGFHDPLEGSLTNKSGFYNVTMATCIVTTLFPGVYVDRVPAMPVKPFFSHEHWDKGAFDPLPPVSVLATIHKLLTRKEMLADPQAVDAVRNS